jgi:hypothetical protein
VARQAGEPGTGAHVGAEWYLSVLLVSAVLLEALAFAASAVGATLGPVVSVVAVVAGPMAAVVLWWWVDDPVPRDVGSTVVLAGMGLLWLIAAAWTVVDGRPASPAALLLPVLLVLAWGKPPSAEAAIRATRALAWTLAGVATATLLLEAVGAVPSWYVLEGVDRQGWIEGDRAAYWLPLADLIGLDARWAGAFNHPNIAGVVGAFLVVLGAASRGATRLAFVLVGGVVLLATSSRTSMAAALGGLCVLIGAWWIRRPSRLPVRLRAMLASMPVLLMLLLWVTGNPGLTGRTTIWPVYAVLWGESPLIGAGQGGIDEAVRAGLLPDWAHHGHSLLLDTAARYGAAGLVVLAVVLAAALVTVVRAARAGDAVGLALIATVLVAGLTETTLRWLYLTVPVAMLVLAVLVSAGTGSRAPIGLPRAPAPGSGPGLDPAQTPAGDGSPRQ